MEGRNRRREEERTRRGRRICLCLLPVATIAGRHRISWPGNTFASLWVQRSEVHRHQQVVPLLKAHGKNSPSCLPQLLKCTQDAQLWTPSSVFKAVVV